METTKPKTAKLTIPNYKKKQIQKKKEPAQALKDNVASLKALVLTSSLLQEAPLPWAHRDRVSAALDFLAALHGQVLQAAISHPDAHLIPELAETIEKLKKGDENGETKEQ